VSKDLLASIVVFLVALPLCMGIAIASGLPPAAGLVTGIIGGTLVGFLQGSPLQVSGPAAGLAVIVWDLHTRYGITALAVIVMLAGLMQMAGGVLKGGRWFRMVPPSVVHGMLAGIGVLIVASQFHVMVDDKPRGSGVANLLSIPESVMKGISPAQGLPHQEAASVGLLVLAVLVLWNKLPGRLRKIPGPLAAVIVAGIVADGFSLPIAHVQVPDDLLGTLTMLTPSSAAGFLLTPHIWAAALAMACVASAETLLSAAAVDSMHSGPRTNCNKELFAQGVGNTLCGIVGALPMTGVIVRSSVNVASGAQTRRSTILHGIWLAMLVLLLPGVLRMVPVSALAAILVYTGMKLASPKNVMKLPRYEIFVYLLTMGIIVCVDLLSGVAAGVMAACAGLLYRLSHLEIRVDDQPEAGRAIVHVEGAATFLRLPDIAEALDRVPRDREVHVRLDRVTNLDHAALELLKSYDHLVVDWDRVGGVAAQESPDRIPTGRTG